jgi:trans-aconitate 2-methyltransferase
MRDSFPMDAGFDGEKYRRASAHQKEWGSKLIAELRLGGAEAILDLGCGDGELTAQLAGLVPQGRVVGIDSAASMIDAARRHRRGNLTFEVMDINQLAYEAEFDLVFSNAALHWVLDHRGLLGRVLRALRNDGVLCWSFAADGNCPTFNRIVRGLMAEGRYAGRFDGFAWPWYMPRIDEYRTLAGSFGFRELAVRGENADRYFPDSDTMIQRHDDSLDRPAQLSAIPGAPARQREGELSKRGD